MAPDLYFELWQELWPQQVSGQPAIDLPSPQNPYPEPPSLAQYIKEMSPTDHDWLNAETNASLLVDQIKSERQQTEVQVKPANEEQDETPEGELAEDELEANKAGAEDNALQDHEQRPIRYLDLGSAPSFRRALGHLRVNQSLCKNTRHSNDTAREILPAFIIRDEYVRFYRHALKAIELGRATFFLTGQPGIGKSFQCDYFVLLLLACGQSFFLIREKETAFFFSDAGVERYRIADFNIKQYNALNKSWVLIDVDDSDISTWTPLRVFKDRLCLIWTSPPRELRLHFMHNQFNAELWFMRPWSTEEIVVATHLRNMDPATISRRYKVVGPIARELFHAKEPEPKMSDDAAIVNVLQGNFFPSGATELLDGNIHPIFMITPQRIEFQLDRKHFTVDFRSHEVADRFTSKVHESFEGLRDTLTEGFYSPATRLLTRKLFESVIHRALEQDRLRLPDVFGGDTVATILGSATTFVRRFDPTDLPVYLNPGALDFGAVDAIVVTDDHVGLLQVFQFP
ncbi:hypothetical protein MIND_00678200 [Mycena indigotica]|uniref:Uncharacterized protein n=1 Tax=Mycena indigotica TaxID=2126181 RepID=A0A8H6SK71_9AGAR|nr:uncharacterized protein MIND_00678200 [Mycena indigotica]KAF7301138.1 hypothetical protein MIND_00678200 [Mycena indigotica]